MGRSFVGWAVGHLRVRIGWQIGEVGMSGRIGHESHGYSATIRSKLAAGREPHAEVLMLEIGTFAGRDVTALHVLAWQWAVVTGGEEFHE